MKLCLWIACVVIFPALSFGCNNPSGESATPRKSSSDQKDSKSSAQPFQPDSKEAHLLSIPAGNSFVVSCSKTIKIPTVGNPINASSSSGIDAAILLAELSQKNGVKICAEYYASSGDQERAFLIDDMGGGSCKNNDTVASAELSLKNGCPAPQTGSQSLSKTGAKAYRRSTVYISGASAEQLKKLSEGWANLNLDPTADEVRRTDDLK